MARAGGSLQWAGMSTGGCCLTGSGHPRPSPGCATMVYAVVSFWLVWGIVRAIRRIRLVQFEALLKRCYLPAMRQQFRFRSVLLESLKRQRVWTVDRRGFVDKPDWSVLGNDDAVDPESA